MFNSVLSLSKWRHLSHKEWCLLCKPGRHSTEWCNDWSLFLCFIIITLFKGFINRNSCCIPSQRTQPQSVDYKPHQRLCDICDHCKVFLCPCLEWRMCSGTLALWVGGSLIAHMPWYMDCVNWTTKVWIVANSVYWIWQNQEMTVQRIAPIFAPAVNIFTASGSGSHFQ